MRTVLTAVPTALLGLPVLLSLCAITSMMTVIINFHHSDNIRFSMISEQGPSRQGWSVHLAATEQQY